MAFRNLNHLTKFYSSVEISPMISTAGENVFHILLDGRRVKTGDNNILEGIYKLHYYYIMLALY